MNTKATATLRNGNKIKGTMTTEHAASSYGQPVFVDENGQAYNWLEIFDINTASEIGRKGGKQTSDAKKKSSAENGKLGGRPRKAI
jgi:general stress protein YciG